MSATPAVGEGPEVRLLLVGKSGVGTSSTGNTILGRDVFSSDCSFSSVTDRCQRESLTVERRRVTVVDTPNFFHSALSLKQLRVELERAVKWCSPGLHTLLFVLTLDTFTEQEADIMSLFKEMFGEEALRFTFVVFTHGDELRDSNIDELIQKNRRLSDLVGDCGGRYHVLNNKDLTNRSQVTELLEKIDSMVADNGNSCYTVEMFQHAQSLTTRCKRVIVSVWRAKSHYLCLICIIALAMGATNAHHKKSLDVLTFTHGCLTGLTAAVFGSISRKLIVQMWMRFYWLHKSRVMMLGIPCGFAAGVVIGEFMGPGGILFLGLAGLAGATGGLIKPKPH